MIDSLRIVTAGAGSGKTHTIQQQIGRWIADGLVAPERIVAVTYTEAAAAELRERISGGLLAAGRIEEALRLSQAYISTIHSLGMRILAEFAFEGGSSPRPRLLNDDEQNALIRRALARTDKADRVISDLRSYGYSFDFVTERSGEQVFRDTLLEGVSLLRSIGATTPVAASRLLGEAREKITAAYGKTDPDTGQTRRLRQRVEQLLDRFPDSLDTVLATSQTAANQFRNDFRCLVRASRPGTLESEWDLWEKLRNLRTGGRSSRPPEEYVRLAAEVKAAAGALVTHAGPLEHAQAHAESLLAAGQDVVEHYDRAKREASLVDYTDMIAAAGRLLGDRPEVLKTLASRIDCLVVDEFQDTNPLQFDLLWRIRQAGIPTLVVGDLKQAIMGFQGADPRLFEALERNHRSASRPLTRNWRSRPALMDFVNAIGPCLFDESYVPLEAQREPGEMAPLEAVVFKSNPRKDRHLVRAHSVGRRLKELLEDPSQTVVGRRNGSVRRLRGSDIAVLCPTHAVAASYAAVLRALGLQASHQSAGWLASRAVQLAWNALAYVANPADRHAALSLCATELGSLTLEEGIRQLIDAGHIDDPVLRRLDAMSEGVADRTIYALVAETLSTLELFDAVSSWTDGEQARANLVRLLGEAAAFMEANREALAHGGYHGHGVETFLGWLAARQDEDEQPAKSVLQEDAITLRTWHGAKGLEWPVVAVCNVDRAYRPRLPSLRLGYSSFDELGSILRNARMDYVPKYAAPEHNEGPMMRQRELLRTESRRLLYVALTRARDKLLLEWPAFQEPSRANESDSYWKLLRGIWSVDPDTQQLRVGGQHFQCTVTRGATELPPGFDLDAPGPEAPLPAAGRRAIRRAAPPGEWTPDSVAASALAVPDTAAPAGDLRTWRYGPGLAVEAELSSTELGTFLHRCFEVLGARPVLAGRMEELTGFSVPPGVETRVASTVRQFEGWLRRQFEIRSMMREWPVLTLDPNGTVVSGEADLVVETPDGVWVLDHKSDRVEDPALTFRKYEPQLEAYARALASEGRTVLGIGLNLIRTGTVIWRCAGQLAADAAQDQVTARARSEPSGTRVP